VDEKKEVDWLSRIMLILGLIVLFVVGWYGLVFARSYGELRIDSERLGEETSNLSMFLFENGLVRGVSDIEMFRGMVVSKGSCLRLWDGSLMRCYELDDNVLALMFLDISKGWVDKRLVKGLESGGWVEKRQVAVTNEESIEAFVSDSERVGLKEMMRLIRFGDIVNVVINVDAGGVMSVIMVYRGGLL